MNGESKYCQISKGNSVLDRKCVIIFKHQANTFPCSTSVFYQIWQTYNYSCFTWGRPVHLWLSTAGFRKTSNLLLVNWAVFNKRWGGIAPKVCVWERSYEDINTCYISMALIGSLVLKVMQNKKSNICSKTAFPCNSSFIEINILWS